MVFCYSPTSLFLGTRSLLGHNGNQLNTRFHIELVLLYRLAIETMASQKRYLLRG
jgi:hypothetical protein